ncbi:MAG: MarR family transcriptional regulator [Paenibacillus sp.]|uniref:MarR family transcriptional regulator n=1 Tax=Paenibacillus sp. TaxID=58172 RepID=UPI00290D4345|nr:MarR family transcriptional regulator [Paenibacillus sp.]MDU4694585.1 MarR family transcriptional regulator [Paenibacillus sp.]
MKRSTLYKDELIVQIMGMTDKLQRRFQSEGVDEERSWMLQQTDNPAVISFLKRATMMMLHVIDAIVALEPVNGIRIASHLGIPRGSVSKITRKLVQEHVIQMEYLPDNKKKIMFRTTSLGKEVSKVHLALHRHVNMNVHALLNRYTPEQLAFLAQVQSDILNTSLVKEDLASIKDDPPPAAENPPEAMDMRQAAQEDPIRDLLDMLHQLDSANLSKAKDLLQVVFFAGHNG